MALGFRVLGFRVKPEPHMPADAWPAVWGRMDENDLPRTLFAVRNVLAPPAEPPKKPEIDPELLKDRVALADIVKAG